MAVNSTLGSNLNVSVSEFNIAETRREIVNDAEESNDC